MQPVGIIGKATSCLAGGESSRGPEEAVDIVDVSVASVVDSLTDRLGRLQGDSSAESAEIGVDFRRKVILAFIVAAILAWRSILANHGEKSSNNTMCTVRDIQNE